MPRSAIATGLVDYILPVAEMPQQLITYVEHAIGRKRKKETAPFSETASALQKIFILLRAQMGHDFSHYKQKTIGRRIQRRMAVNQIEQVDHYVRYLQQTPMEVRRLFRELLITVTNFFRDPEAFAVLEEQVIPTLLKKPPNHPIRIWVPGCATGEEAYSITILLQEQMAQSGKRFDVQVFATDIAPEAIETARAGVYPDGIAADVSSERLSRFFTQEDNAYHVNKSIRDMVIFAEQNVIADPPFSRIDLISCRNLLIYLGSELQEKAIRLFHYALDPQSYLFLGTSESIGGFTDLFEAVDRKHKLFRSKEATTAFAVPRGFPSPSSKRAPVDAPQGKSEERIGIREVAERSLLEHFTPACVIIDENGQILYVHGRTGQYLETPPGKATLEIQRMAREGLELELTTAIHKARTEAQQVRYPGIAVRTNGAYRTIDLTVRPVTDLPGTEGLLMVTFEDVTPEEAQTGEESDESAKDQSQHITRLKRELRAKEEHLQTTIEELETSTEELKSTNEELQSSNEELQSTNEELETAKEEAQSINEELVTVNAELEQRIEDLTQVNDDMKNLLAGTGIGTIFLDEHLHIQRFTPPVTEIINLIQADIGRPVSHITSNLANYDALAQEAQEVLDTLVPREQEVQTREGSWYLLRIRPYRTRKNVIEGVVLTFVDITDLKQAEQEIQEARDYAESILATIREPLIIMDADLTVVSANRSFYQTFEMKPSETEGTRFFNLGNGVWDIPRLRKLLEEILQEKTVFNDYEVEHDFADIGWRRMLLNAREIRQAEGKERLILLAIDDVTKHHTSSSQEGKR
jgi:two-component system CheB/CheR fusion protein